ncbi:MAG: dihydrolipoamide acetyltransferase family protein [Solirubrobacterales bacterium]
MNVATAIEITMPKLSDSMEEGTILSWLVEPGAEVAAGTDLLGNQADKANMTVQAEAAGVLEILVPEGETVTVQTPIARRRRRHRAGRRAGPRGGVPARARERVGDPQEPSRQPSRGRRAPAGDGAQRSTPIARRIAAIHGIDLETVSGSGLGGRITKADAASPPASTDPASPELAAELAAVEAFLRSRRATSSSSAGAGRRGQGDELTPTRLQAVIARRMAKSKGTVPHFQVETEVRMDAAIELRAKLKELAGEESPPSINDLIVKASAIALQSYPKANGSYRDGRFELHPKVNVGIAVAAEDALVVPTIKDADRKSLGEIGRESRWLAARVRSGELTPPELAGGTFTVSNLGMFGMTAIHPVINLPQAAILGIGTMRDVRARGVDGEIEDTKLMTLTLSCDHRILYGAEAARFLGAIRDLLEQPLRIAF